MAAFVDYKMIGLDWVVESTDKAKVIQSKLRTTHSQQKSYANKRGRPLNF